jgi:hypothetical protein
MKKIFINKRKMTILASIASVLFFCASYMPMPNALAAQQSNSGAMGIEGEIPSTPPTTAPSISIPRNGQVFTNIPITVTGPYAISVDWGDKSTEELISRSTPGQFNVNHVFAQSGIYNVTVKVTDANGASAFLQVVGISNGPIQQTSSASTGSSPTPKSERVIIWWPMLVLLALIIIAFWLGKRHQLAVIRGRLHRGERPI